MANYRKRYSTISKKWTPVAVVGKTLSTRKIAEHIEKESTVSISDIMAVLYALPHVMRSELANGNAVKLDGIGSFALTVQCSKTGVDSAEDVDPYTQITNVKVQFRPEKESVLLAGGKKKMVTTLVANDITWLELKEKKGTMAGGGTSSSTTPSGDNQEPVETANVTINAVANDAQMGSVSGGGTYVQGASVTLTATPNTGYHFVQWSNGRTTASITVTADADATFTATFAADNPGGNGGDNGMDG